MKKLVLVLIAVGSVMGSLVADSKNETGAEEDVAGDVVRSVEQATEAH